jgi:Acetyltransferase (GNAT) domain
VIAATELSREHVCMSSTVASNKTPVAGTTSTAGEPSHLRDGVYVERWDALAGAERAYWIDEWERLFYLDPEAKGFQHPRYVNVEICGLPQQLPTLLIADFKENELQQLAILLPKIVPTNKLTGLKLGWNVAGYRLAGNRVLTRSPSRATSTAILAEIKQQVERQGGSFLLLEDLDRRDPLHAGLGLTAKDSAGQSTADITCPTGFQPRQRIVLPATPADYWSKFSSKTRSKFRRNLKKFGENQLERVTRREELPAFLEAAHQISKQTWQTRQFGLRVRNDQRELAELGALADLGFLRCYLRRVDGLPAAFMIGNQAQGTYHHEEVGYMTHLAKFSPGQMLLVQVLDDLLTHDTPLRFDFGGGDAEYKQLFANDTSESGTVWWICPSLKGRATFGFIGACGFAKRAVRSLVRSAGLATKVRQWIRYGGKRANAPLPVEVPAQNAVGDDQA